MRNKTVIILSMLFVVLGACPSMALWGQDLRVSLSYEANYLLGGQAGRFDIQTWPLEPNLNEIYGLGMGPRIELGWRFEPDVEVLLGFGYVFYKGDTETLIADSGDQVIFSLSDFEAAPIYAGVKYLFSEDPRSGFAPYVRLDLGTLIVGKVNTRFAIIRIDPDKQRPDTEATWWGASNVFLWDLGGGIEYGRGSLGFFAELLYQSYGKPDSAFSRIFPPDTIVTSEGTGWSPITLRMGVSYYF